MTKILVFIWGKLKAFLKWFLRLLWGLIYDNLIKGTARRKIVGWALSLGAGWLGLIFAGPPEIASALNPLPKDYSSEFRKIQDGLFQSEIRAIAREKEFKHIMDSTVKAALSLESKRIIDSMEQRDKRLIGLNVGRGSVGISGSGAIVDNKFSDPWISAVITPDTARKKYELRYDFTFEINDVQYEFSGSEGERTELYQIELRSLTDPDVRLPLPEFKRKKTMQIVEEKDNRSWYWWDPTLHGGMFLSEYFEGGLGLSVLTWSSGGREPDAVIVRLPVVGLSTNFSRSYHLVAGVGVNFAHYLPLIKDLYMFLGYGAGTTSNIIVGLTTTL